MMRMRGSAHTCTKGQQGRMAVTFFVLAVSACGRSDEPPVEAETQAASAIPHGTPKAQLTHVGKSPAARSLSAEDEYRIMAAAVMTYIGPYQPKVCLRRDVDATSRENLFETFRPDSDVDLRHHQPYFDTTRRFERNLPVKRLGAVRIDPDRFIAANPRGKIKNSCAGLPEVSFERPQAYGQFALIDATARSCGYTKNQLILHATGAHWKVIASRKYLDLSPFVCGPQPKIRAADYLTIEGEGARIRPAPPQPPPPPLPPDWPGGRAEPAEAAE